MADLATSQDYLDYTGASAVPDNITALLRSASRLVRRDTVTAVYDVDTAGNATNSVVIDALRDATCAQAAAWDDQKINPLAGGVVVANPVATSKSLDGASITYAGAQQAAAVRAAIADCLVPEAVDILTAAGLTSGRPLTYG